MHIETVEWEPQPMLHVTRSSGMIPGEISEVMGEAFETLGAFFARAGVAPAGPPLAVYRNRDGANMKIDIGFPVTASDAARAEGDVKSALTPSGRALTTVYSGPYEGLKTAYGELEDHLRTAGLPMPSLSWEVYLDDPFTTPPEDLKTRICMPVS
ncbi:GyrI-like domain-containing protein [Brevundimonas sp.]|uniref:GyrI-like domain-containing protein n=1 Tax=Brevundimonas sp. TaxID=1871086 RepID=UPI002737F848|nr:GyrI-like domain-containing protein [Brevundimonas sp.]MDP3801668.1 GyrI-like domain-containing protein [Brevundimonas sp.]